MKTFTTAKESMAEANKIFGYLDSFQHEHIDVLGTAKVELRKLYYKFLDRPEYEIQVLVAWRKERFGQVAMSLGHDDSYWAIYQMKTSYDEIQSHVSDLKEIIEKGEAQGWEE